MADGAYVLERNGHPVVSFELDLGTLLLNELNVSSMHIASAADWYYRGRKVELTHEIFQAMVARFGARKAPLVVDYFHGSAEPDPSAPEKSAAAGWIHSMWITGTGATAMLWASVEWTERAAKLIRAKEMRFCSPEFGLAIPSVHDNSIGPELLAVGLTNRPHQDNLQAILMSRTPADDADKSDKPEGDDKPAPDSVPEGDKGGDAPAEGDTPAPEGDKPAGDTQLATDAPAATDAAATVKDDAAMLMDVANALSRELGIDLGSTIAKMQKGLSAMASALGANNPQPNDAGASLFVRLERDQLKRGETVLLARVAELESQIKAHADKAAQEAAAAAEAAKQAEEKRIADHVQMCIDEGRVHLGNREDAIKAFAQDWDLAERIFAQVVVPVEQRSAGGGGGAQPNLLHTKKFTRDELTPGEALAVDSLIPLMGEERAIERVVELRR